MSQMTDVSEKKLCMIKWHCILSYFAERFDEMPSVTENIKFEMWNCAPIGVWKAIFFIFFLAAWNSSNCSVNYKPYLVLRIILSLNCLQDAQYNATFSLKVDRCPISPSNELLAFWLPFHAQKWNTSLFYQLDFIQTCTEWKYKVVKMCKTNINLDWLLIYFQLYALLCWLWTRVCIVPLVPYLLHPSIV